MQSGLKGRTAASPASLAGPQHPQADLQPAWLLDSAVHLLLHAPTGRLCQADLFCKGLLQQAAWTAWSMQTSLSEPGAPDLQGHKAPVMGMAVDPSGAMLATASADSTVKVWDTAGTYCTHSFAGHRSAAGGGAGWSLLHVPLAAAVCALAKGMLAPSFAAGA